MIPCFRLSFWQAVSPPQRFHPVCRSKSESPRCHQLFLPLTSTPPVRNALFTSVSNFVPPIRLSFCRELLGAWIQPFFSRVVVLALPQLGAALIPLRGPTCLIHEASVIHVSQPLLQPPLSVCDLISRRQSYGSLQLPYAQPVLDSDINVLRI